MSRLKHLGALAASAALLACVLPAGAHAATTAPTNPIVFVHGFPGLSGPSEVPTWWDVFIGKLKRDGYTQQYKKVIYYGVTPNKLVAFKVKDKVNELYAQTGKKVDIVTHSMGGVSSRWYLKTMGGASSSKVRSWVSLGGPNRGLNLQFCAIFIGFPCTELLPNGPFMTTLNSFDSTPGNVKYLTLRSVTGTAPIGGEDYDGVVPAWSVPLKCKDGGLTNLQVNGVQHNAMIRDEGIYVKVRDWLTGTTQYPCVDNPTSSLAPGT